MFHELQILSWAIILGLVQLFAAAHLSTKQRGIKWNMSARDQQPQELTGAAGRLDRAFKNFLETFVFFAAAILIVEARRKNSDISLYGAAIYFFARLVYVPLYAAGIPKMRSIVWFISIIGLFMVLSQALV